jgi:dihydroorotase
MCHAPAECFKINRRGYIREGFWADLVLVDLEKKYNISPENILYKCGWSPLDGVTFGSAIVSTIVSGQLLYHEGNFFPTKAAKRLQFDR